METLVNILKEETKSLKIQFLEKTREYSINYYNKIQERKNWYEVEWCKFFGITPEIKNPNTRMEYLGYPKGFHNTKNSRDLNRFRNEISRISRMSLDEYINKELKLSEIHYDNSINKLAERIKLKGLNLDNLKVETSHIGVNINTTLTDGEKTIRAFTIIAGGDVQQPHYRYLIK